jgi:dihydroorotate dehydrogenase electron transfer subunit
VRTEEVKKGYHRLRFKPQTPFTPEPGQFVMVRVRGGIEPLLRRPFGVHRFDAETGEFEVLFREVGAGTKLLAHARVGDTLDVLAPLGRGFGPGGERPLLVGGGIGVAPLHFLAERYMSEDKRVKLLLGGRTEHDILCHRDFERIDLACSYVTEDGSFGETGLVTQLLSAELDTASPSDRSKVSVHVCGPIPMLAAVARLCEGYGVACEVSLESHMACGVGACLGCVVKGKDGANLRVCKEGPVFPASDIDWP